METLFILVAAVIIAIIARIYWGTKRKVPVTLADPNAKYRVVQLDFTPEIEVSYMLL